MKSRKKKPRPYTAEEIALAKQLFERAKETGTLKEPRGLFALGLANGYRASEGIPVTYCDYLREARLMLAKRSA